MKIGPNRKTTLLVLLVAVSPCFGWGSDGHRITGTIASAHLTPEAKAAVTQLRGDQSLADVSTWADEIKSDPSFRWASPLHYANVQPDADGFDLKRDCPEEGCVVSAIIKYAKVLGDKESSRAEKTEALKFLVHFVGDIHQPLHVSYARDKGGNDIKVEFFHDRTNLHRVWDSGLIRRTKKGWTEYATELEKVITPEQIAQWKSTDPVAWATESYKLALSHAYEIPKDGQLGQAYFDRCIPVVNRRLTMAGVRLATLLNATLAKDPAARPAATTEPSGNTGETGFLDWAKESAIRLDSLEWSNTPATAFTFLDQALQGKRVVFLGESDHFVAERMEFRLLLIRELARRGFRRIGMEMGLSDAKRMDRFLETGDQKWLDRVALYGYRGDMRQDRKDEIAGWTDDSHPEFTRTVLDEAKWFLRQLRKINEELPPGEPRLSWFGYDLSFRPGGGYADATELLAPHQDTPLARRVKERMARVPGESRIEEAARLEALVAMLDQRRDELVATTGEADALDLRRSLQRMADAFRFIDALPDLSAYDPQIVAEALSKRERRMDRNFDEYLAEWPPDEKIILLGHALHLSKDSESIQTQNFGLMWKSIGTHLAGRLPGEVYGIWLLHDRGRHGLMHGVPSVQSFRSPKGSVERLLAQVHPVFMLPLGSGDSRAAWLQKERTFSQSGAPAQAVLPRQIDCVFFIETANEPGQRRGDRNLQPR